MITDGDASPDYVLRAATEAIAGGVRWIQLRRRYDDAGAFYQLALELRDLTTRSNAALIINDRIDIAVACHADGVHLAETGVPCAIARLLLGEGKLIGRSVHRHHEITAAIAVADGISARPEAPDYFQFGPVYDTPSKRAFGPPQGLARLSDAAEAARGVATSATQEAAPVGVPVIAVGGIQAERVAEVRAAGAAGVAAIGVFADHRCAKKAAEAFVRAF